MTSLQTLGQCFLAHLSEPRSVQLSPSALEPLLRAISSQACATWPTVLLSTEQFVAYLAERVDGADDPIKLLQRLKNEDLYLACACAHGSEQALVLFEKHFGPVIDGALFSQGFSETQVEEVKQVLRRDLFVGQGDAPPLITRYAGRGRLRGWIQITAARHALKLLRKEKKLRSLGEQTLQALPALADDAEMQYMKRVYRAAFKEAFQQGLASLSPRAINVLRHHFVDGLTTAQIGAIYRIHQTTAGRWLSKAQQQLLERTKQALIDRLKLKPAEYDTILRLVVSQMDITMRTFLGEKEGP